MESLTFDEIILIADKHFPEIEKIWMEMSEDTVLYQAVIEWCRRNGREIELKR